MKEIERGVYRKGADKCMGIQMNSPGKQTKYWNVTYGLSYFFHLQVPLQSLGITLALYLGKLYCSLVRITDRNETRHKWEMATRGEGTTFKTEYGASVSKGYTEPLLRLDRRLGVRLPTESSGEVVILDIRMKL